MYLWRLKRHYEDCNWDEVTEMIVRAETVQKARAIADKNGAVETMGGEHPWLVSKKSTCRKIYVEGREAVILTANWG